MKLTTSMILTIIAILFVGCSQVIVRPITLPYDCALDRKIEKQKKEMIKSPEVKVGDIRQQLNDYETLRQKSKTAIIRNNNLAKAS